VQDLFPALAEESTEDTFGETCALWVGSPVVVDVIDSVGSKSERCREMFKRGADVASVVRQYQDAVFDRGDIRCRVRQAVRKDVDTGASAASEDR
jgi:hypothetical protein